MVSLDAQSQGTLPEGDADPNLVYIAVGKAIHAWEGLEEALANLALKMSGIAESPDNLAAFGRRNRTFTERIAALTFASTSYFVRHHNQAIEGTFLRLIQSVENMAIERHRIAHGHISMAGEFNIPTGSGVTVVTARAFYRWAAPFYSMGNLRTDPFGKGSK
jgi:hypothetical protein